MTMEMALGMSRRDEYHQGAQMKMDSDGSMTVVGPVTESHSLDSLA